MWNQDHFSESGAGIGFKEKAKQWICEAKQHWPQILLLWLIHIPTKKQKGWMDGLKEKEEREKTFSPTVSSLSSDSAAILWGCVVFLLISAELQTPSTTNMV